jgi:hypothetical protein
VLCVPQLLTLNSGFEYFYLRARGPPVPATDACTDETWMAIATDRRRRRALVLQSDVCFNARWTLNRYPGPKILHSHSRHRKRLYRYR